jgi:hypothetical protein
LMVNSQKDSSGIHNFQSWSSWPEDTRHHHKSHQMKMTSTLKPSFFHKLKTRLFGNFSSSGPKSWGLTGDVKSAWLRFVFTSTVAICESSLLHHPCLA